ncbi:MAG TPA: threonylcarbamoyl-AMP synthase [Chromatiales bacterium]|nr:threonylcarbamoyl-AMP synthase [Chromatiales bacterium]
MTQIFRVHPRNPQRRLLRQAAEVVRAGGVIVYPTDSSYALGCRIGEKEALERIRAIRRLEPGHNFTLVCRDLSELATYARVDNAAYRFLKALTPGPYTFILRATKEVPRRLQHPRRRTIGIRVPDHVVTQALLEEVGEPLLSVTCQLPGDELPLTDPEEIRERLRGRVDLVVDAGACGVEPTTVIDLVSGVPVVVRRGIGDVEPLGLGEAEEAGGH